MFQGKDNWYIYSLDSNNNVSEITDIDKGLLFNVFPSSSDNNNLKSAAYREGNCLIYKDKADDVRSPIKFYSNGVSVVRVYKDVFLLYDCSTKGWVLSRIIVP